MTNYANRGTALEDLIILSNQVYQNQRLAVVDKVPTAWLPIRDHRGRIVSAKVTEKSIVDFRGHVPQCGHAIPVAFDAKETRQDKWRLSHLEPHQYEYLADCQATNACAFILIGFMTRERFFVLPFPAIQERWDRWKKHGRPASISINDPALIEVRFPMYLKWLTREINLPRATG